MPVSNPILVLTTLGTATDAEAFASTLVEERLAACVNVLPPMTSVYRWRDAVERDKERQLIIKSTRDRLEALQARLLQMHPYELPELIVVDAEGGSRPYLDGIEASTRPPAAG
jgi:periplasmic divalent cation tolerance protein